MRGWHAAARAAVAAAAVAALAVAPPPAGGARDRWNEGSAVHDEEIEHALEAFVRRKMAEDPGLRPGWPPETTPEALIARWHALIDEFAEENHLSPERVLRAWQASLGEEWEWPAQEERDPHPEQMVELVRAEQLVSAAGAGDLERVGALLDGGAPADHPYEDTDTALLAAAAGGHEAVVALLLERGADPNRTGRRGRSALDAAYQAESLTIARRLFDAGARVAAGKNKTLLGTAIADRRSDWIDLLRAHGATLGSYEANRLLTAALEEKTPDRLDRMRLLLDLGADPGYRPANGVRPLIHLAVLDDAAAEMDLLVERGADVEATDGLLGESTLHVAVKSERTALVERLLNLGADVDARAKDGTTPLFAPLARRRDELARRLIAAGARVDVASEEGRTPLMELAAWRPPRATAADADDALGALIELLIERGAAIDAVDRRGNSALSLAGAACNLPALSTLARHGAAIDADAWVEVLQAPCAPRWPQVVDGLRADLDLPVPSLDELSRGPLAPPDPIDADAQRRTVKEIRDLGTALMSWLTDQVARNGAAPRVRLAADGEEAGTELSSVPAVSAAQLRRLLVPLYLHDVPEVDGWGFRYDFRIAASVTGPGPVLVVRSPGSDGRFSGDRYPEPRLPKGLFPSGETHRDIVWVDGRFLQAPRLVGGAGLPAAPCGPGPGDGGCRRLQPAAAGSLAATAATIRSTSSGLDSRSRSARRPSSRR